MQIQLRKLHACLIYVLLEILFIDSNAVTHSVNES